jgi:hypothetical protein
MKSKYTPLVKLKKKELDRIERDLIGANNSVKLATTLREEAYALLQSLSLPSSGSISQFTQAQMLFQAQHQEIENCNLNLAKAQHYQLLIQQQFKAAMIEYEKFKYLEMQEQQAYSVKIKKEEAKMLDEIGVMTHKREPL